MLDSKVLIGSIPLINPDLLELLGNGLYPGVKLFTPGLFWCAHIRWHWYHTKVSAGIILCYLI